jgi:hypothetical protein
VINYRFFRQRINISISYSANVIVIELTTNVPTLELVKAQVKGQNWSLLTLRRKAYPLPFYLQVKERNEPFSFLLDRILVGVRR